MSDRIVWTGENWPEFRKFLGRPDNAKLISYNFSFLSVDLPDGTPVMVTARPGDTVIKLSDGRFDVEHAA